MKCEKCNKEHPGPWPLGYTHVYCECGHKWEVANLDNTKKITLKFGGKSTQVNSVSSDFSSVQLTKINGAALSGMSVNFETEFGKFEITVESEEQARAVFTKLEILRGSGERIKIQYA